jgi:putative membrane protein
MIRTAKWALVLAAGVLFTVAVGAEDKKDAPKDAPKDTKKDDKAFSDAEFVKKAAIGGMHEVAAGKLAAAQGKSEAVKKFGQKMVDDHSKANDELKAAAKKANLDVPAKLDDEHQKHIDHLKGLKGEEFDKAYIKHMIEDHEEDVAEFTRASKEAKDAGVKEFATKTLPVVQGHLDEVKKMDKGGK